MRKKVCIIRSNPVRPDSRVEKEAWTLLKEGYDVHILSWDRDSNHDEQDGFIFVADERIPITWLGYKAAFNEGMKSLKPYMKFQFHMRRWIQQHRNEIDVIHACDFDTAFFSRGKSIGKRFVFDIFDFLYGEPKSILQFAVKRAQLCLINSADATIICTEERREQIHDAHPKRLAVIHNTPCKTFYNSRFTYTRLTDQNRIVLGFSGKDFNDSADLIVSSDDRINIILLLKTVVEQRPISFMKA